MGGRIGSDAGVGRSEQEEARRRSAEAAVSQATSTDASRQATIHRRPVIPTLPPVSDDVVREFARNVASAQVPPAVADLSLYTDQVLEREIAASRARLGMRGGAAAEGERFIVGRLESELVKRHTPRSVDASALASLPEVETAINDERTFLARFRVELTPSVRADHQRTLGALWQRRETLLADEHACRDARPVAATLGGGVDRVVFTADDLVASLKRQITLTPQAEAQVRGTFERWHRDTCRLTGDDPTVRVNPHYTEAKIDHVPAQQAELEMRLAMLEATRTSACAALAFLDSAARGDSVAAAHARVMSASTLSDLALTMPSRPPSMHAESPRAEAREVEGLAQKHVDDARGAGHAQNTRFRGVDNSQFARDPGKITYGPWRKNVDGARTIEQAKAIFEKQTGLKVPPWMIVVVDAKLPEGRDAEYVFDRSARPGEQFDRLRLARDGVVVRVRPGVFESDEAIVGVLRHEVYELEKLAKKLETTPMTNADVRAHTADGRGQNLHGQAWDVADLEVLIMRETPGTAKHGQLLARRVALLARFELQNNGKSP